MAFGPAPPKGFIGKFGVSEDLRWRAYLKTESSSKVRWEDKWEWILEEYKKLKQDLDAKSAKYFAAQPVVGRIPHIEHRSMKPVPESISHQIGWLASKKEFKLEKYGPDVYSGMPFKSLY